MFAGRGNVEAYGNPHNLRARGIDPTKLLQIAHSGEPQSKGHCDDEERTNDG